jgi:hypothetical protein
MPLGSAIFNPNAAKPTMRKAKVFDALTGQVIQEAGPYSEAEAGELRAAQAVVAQGMGQGAGGLPSFGGGGPGRTGGGGGAGGATGMTRGRGMAPLKPLGGPVRSSVSTGGGGLPPFGGGGGGGSGGGSASYAPRAQGRSYSDRDGLTTAPRAAAAGGGLEDFYAQNQDSRPKAQVDALTTGVNALANVVPWFADGTLPPFGGGPDGAMQPLQPFIAGDPQRDGKANPELVWPTPSGTHVIPLKDLGELPKFGEGTLKKTGRGGDAETRSSERTPRVDGRVIETKPALQPLRGLAEFRALNPGTPNAAQREFLKRAGALPPLVPIPMKAYGTVEQVDRLPELPEALLPALNRYTQEPDQVARDDDGNIVGFSSGGLPPGMPSLEAQRDALMDLLGGEVGKGSITREQANAASGELYEGASPAAVRGKLSQAWRHNQALRPLPPLGPSPGNPLGIEVGVTPRPALRPLEPLPGMPGYGSEDKAFARMDRDVMRLARQDPRMAYTLRQDRAQSEAARMEAAARMAMEQLQQDRTDARFNVERQDRLDAAAVDRNFKLEDLSWKAVERAQMFTNPEFVPVAGSGGGVIMKGDKLGSGYIPTPKEAGLVLRPLEGTGLHYPSDGAKVDMTRPFEMTQPGMPIMAPFPALPGAPFSGMLPPLPTGMSTKAQFKPGDTKDAKVQKEEAADRVKMRQAGFKRTLDTLSTMLEKATGDDKIKIQSDINYLLRTQLDEGLRDINGDGIPDVVLPSRSTAPSAPKPTTGFLSAAQ